MIALVVALVPLTLGALILALAAWPLAVRVVVAFVVAAIGLVAGFWLYVVVLNPWPAGN
jgi:Tfp pilus assembly protein PilO